MDNQVDICDLKLCNTCMSCICLLELRCKYHVYPIYALTILEFSHLVLYNYINTCRICITQSTNTHC